jgi:uncharacterized membrane protein
MANLLENLVYFLGLTTKTELLWTVLPLVFATIVMLFYYEKYEEKPGWESHVANSMVLLFVSAMMLKYIYNINNLGAINYVDFPGKFFVSLAVLILGLIMLLMNFQRFLPEKTARAIASPLTMNLLAYVLLLYVYSETKDGVGAFLALLFLYVALLLVFNLIRMPIKSLFNLLKKMKEKEKLEEVMKKKKEIIKHKTFLSKEEQKLADKKRKIEEGKKQIKKHEKETVKKMMQEFDKQKKQAIKLKKVVKKPVKKR